MSELCFPIDSMALAEYQSIVAALPVPTATQQQNFARYVSEAHSWYASPLFGPGIPFCIFIDPFAGHDRLLSDGSVRFAAREKRGFHYSDIPTQKYHERYGFLAYQWFHRMEADSIAEHQKRAPGVEVAAIANKNRQLRSLPPEIVRAGSIRLTAAVHYHCANLPWWDLLAPRDAGELDWPKESGGREALRRIFARCRELREAPFKVPEGEFEGELGSHYVDPVLHALLSPERERQQRTIVQAIHRVFLVVGGPFLPSPPSWSEPTGGATDSQLE